MRGALRGLRKIRTVGCGIAALCLPVTVLAQPMPSDPEFDEILAHDIADLTVTSVSKRPQKLNSLASAVYVVTKEDIRRIGAKTIPDALRIVPGLQVAQSGSNKWAISARGFNGTLSNKLLVMIDGQSVYTPVFSGTYWDDRMVPMDEIERIEVIRGPGASVWGANAMNGIIHIITKNAKDEPGGYATASYGTEWRETGGGYSGKLGDASYRAYADHFDADSADRPPGEGDDWDRSRAGFRIDGTRSNDDSFNITGRAYTGQQDNFQTLPQRLAPFSQSFASEDDSYGGSLSGNLEHKFSKDSTGNLKIGLDHYTRNEAVAHQHVSTLDLDWQHDIQTSARNTFSWGTGYRFTNVGIEGSFTARVSEESRNYNLFSAFLQDEYALMPEELFLTVGSKLEHNDFTGFEVQPSARLSWLVDSKQTLWGAVSRAVRTPSIVDDDINLIFQTGPGPTYNVLFGSPGVRSEDMIAYELGYRVEVTPKLQLDNTVYFNDYDNLVTYEPGASYLSASGLTFVNPYFTNNEGRGHVYGFETAATYTASPTHKLMGSYSFAKMDLEAASGSISLDSQEALLPEHTFSARSYWNVTPTVDFDNMLYYVDDLGGGVPSYLRYDTRLAWRPAPPLELSLTGQNLLDDSHPEFRSGVPTGIERSVIGRATWRF